MIRSLLSRIRRAASTALFLAMLPSAASAALTIEIVGGGANQIPVAVTAFVGDGGTPQGLAGVIRADLARTGLFKTLDTGDNPVPPEPQVVNWGDWRGRGAEALVAGGVTQRPDGRLEVRFRLFDVAKQTSLAGVSYTVTPAQLRTAAHRIADEVYEKLTGDRGVFSTKIAYVVKQGRRFTLEVADADGFNPQSVVNSNEPIISPAWSPDGAHLAYVSFEAKKPVVYVQSLLTGQRLAVAEFRGSNSAPAWAPDGKRLAVVLSREGGSQLYLVGADGKGVRRLAQSPGIDTEPSFSPDGQWIYFTSDRGGSPQIYRISAAGGPAERLTFEGSYNASPRVSPDGKSFAFIQRNNGRFQVAVQDIASRQVQLLTDGSLDESPSFAPNGKIILYASELRGRGVLAAVSGDGRVKQRLTASSGDVREPAWGPLPRNP